MVIYIYIFSCNFKISASKYGSSVLLLEAKQPSTAQSSNLKLQDQKTQVSYGNSDKINCHHAGSTTLITFYRYKIHSIRNPRSNM